MKKKIFCEGASDRFILDARKELTDFKKANISVIGFSGSVSPEAFGEAPYNGKSSSSITISTDSSIFELLNRSLWSDNIKLVICMGRAAFIACALAGGGLLQNVSNHNEVGLKEAMIEGEPFLIPSTHTELMHPYNLPKEDYEVLAYSLEKSTRYEGKYAKDAIINKNYKEAEFILFKSFEKPVLAFTPDLNVMRINARALTATNLIIEKYFNKNDNYRI